MPAYLDAREPALLMAICRLHRAPGYGVALLDLSTGEFTAAEYAGAGRAVRRWPTSSPSCARAKCCAAAGVRRRRRRWSTELRLDARLTPADDWTFEFEVGAARR